MLKDTDFELKSLENTELRIVKSRKTHQLFEIFIGRDSFWNYHGER